MIWVLVGIGIIIALPFISRARRWPMDGTARNAAPGQFAKLSGGLTHYQWHGPVRGPVAVCIHGLTTPSYVWGPIAKGLSMMGYRVLTYDLYGRGFSDRPEGPQDRAFFLNQLNELLQELELGEDLTIIGYSMGGSIATCFAADAPHRVDRLILLATAGLTHNASGLEKFAANTPVIGDWITAVLGGWHLRRSRKKRNEEPSAVQDIGIRQDDETRTRGFLEAVLASQRGLLKEHLDKEHRLISKTDIPVLAIWAEKDTAIPLRAMGLLAQANRRAHQVTIADATHALPFTHPREVMKAIQDHHRDH